MLHRVVEPFFAQIDEIAAKAGLPRLFYDDGAPWAKERSFEEGVSSPLEGHGPGEPRLAVYRDLPGRGGWVGDRLYLAILPRMRGVPEEEE